MSLMTPKEDHEISLEALARETKRIRMERSKKVRKPTQSEMVERNNSRMLTILRRESKIPTMQILETEQKSKIIQEATLGKPSKHSMTPVVIRKQVPIRDFHTIGAWGY